MRVIVLSFFFSFCFLVTSIQAQIDPVRCMYLGGNVGIAYEDLSENRQTTGYIAEVFMELPLPSNWAILVGVGASSLGRQTALLDVSNAGGVELSNPNFNIYREGLFQYNYIHVPVKIKRYFGVINAGVGLSLFAFNQNEVNYSRSFHFVPKEETIPTYVMEDVRILNPAVSFSIAYHIRLGEFMELFIEPETQYFLRPVFDGVNTNSLDTRFLLFGKVGIRKAIFSS